MVITERLLREALSHSSLAYLFDPAPSQDAREGLFDAEPDEEYEEYTDDFEFVAKLPGLTLSRALELYEEAFLDDIFSLLIPKLRLSNDEAWFVAKSFVQAFPNDCWPPKPKESDCLSDQDYTSIDIRASFYGMYYETVATLAAIRERCKPESEKDPTALFELLLSSIIRREHLVLEWRRFEKESGLSPEPVQDERFGLQLFEDELPAADDDDNFDPEVALPIMKTFEAILDQVLESRVKA